MKNLNKLKILIVGLTTVLALSNFNNRNLQKRSISLNDDALNLNVYQNNFIQINTEKIS